MFIGSSKANVEYANSIRNQIGPEVRCRVWSEDEAFSDPKSATVQAILEAPARYDYAVFVIGMREDQSRQLLGLRVRDILTCTLGVFKISFGAVGGTELRLLLALGNLALLAWPRVALLGREWLLYDVVGAMAIAGLAVVLIVTTARNTRALYELERLPALSRP